MLLYPLFSPSSSILSNFSVKRLQTFLGIRWLTVFIQFLTNPAGYCVGRISAPPPIARISVRAPDADAGTPHIEEAHDLMKTARKAVTHTPDHGESDADEDG